MSKDQILYIAMDNVLVNFASGVARLSADTVREFAGRLDEVPGIYSLMDPMKGAVEAYDRLSVHFDTYLVSMASWKNPSAWQNKPAWVQRYLGEKAQERLILTHHKNLIAGDYLIDSCTKNGADEFKGIHIQFGTEKFPSWKSVVHYLLRARVEKRQERPWLRQSHHGRSPSNFWKELVVDFA